jgi:chromate transporter
MTIAAHSAKTKQQQIGSSLEVLLAFLRLGVTCFGGPIAHIGYFRDEFVVRHHCIDEQAIVRAHSYLAVATWCCRCCGRRF